MSIQMGNYATRLMAWTTHLSDFDWWPSPPITYSQVCRWHHCIWNCGQDRDQPVQTVIDELVTWSAVNHMRREDNEGDDHWKLRGQQVPLAISGTAGHDAGARLQATWCHNQQLTEMVRPYWVNNIQTKTLEAVQWRACQITTGGSTYKENWALLQLKNLADRRDWQSRKHLNKLRTEVATVSTTCCRRSVMRQLLVVFDIL